MLTMLTALGIVGFSFVGHAQNTLAGKVNGSVYSAQKAVESASISLLRAKDSSVAKLSVSDKNGVFEMENVRAGKYLVSVQALGYTRYYSNSFEISAEKPQYSLNTVELKQAAGNLTAVTVVSQKPLVEQKIDRTVVNVEASVTNTGSTALEVLEKSPGISVDKDGNISLKGKTGVQVFVDGRPTYLSGQDLANMLRNMQSAQMDQIEIMTNPPAKYDAAGNSGVINIKTKKNKQVGYNGSITAGYGQGVYGRTNASANMNYRTGKVNLFGNVSYAYRERFNDLFIQRKFMDASKVVKSHFSQENNLFSRDEPLNLKLGMDYFVSKKTTVGIVLNGGVSDQQFRSKGLPLSAVLSHPTSPTAPQPLPLRPTAARAP